MNNSISPSRQIIPKNNPWNPEDDSKNNFSWSFRPMLIAFRIFGIDLKWDEQRSSTSQQIIRLICTFWFITNTAILVDYGVYFCTENETANNSSFLYQFTGNIDRTVGCVETAGIYSVLLMTSWKNGQQLVESFKQIQNRCSFNTKIYRKLRTLAIIGIIFSVTVILPAYIVKVIEFVEKPTFINVWYPASKLQQIYMNLSTVMFCTLALALADQYAQIEEQIRNVSLLERDVIILVNKWSVHASLTCLAIRKVQNYFSFVLLLSITCIFIETITYCHFAFLFLSGNVQLDLSHAIFPFVQIFRRIILLNAICYAADLMQIKALSLHQSLMESHFLQSQHHSRVFSLMTQVHQSLPKLTAGGYAVINRQMIPTLFGTTLTYLVILVNRS